MSGHASSTGLALCSKAGALPSTLHPTCTAQLPSPHLVGTTWTIYYAEPPVAWQQQHRKASSAQMQHERHPVPRWIVVGGHWWHQCHHRSLRTPPKARQRSLWQCSRSAGIRLPPTTAAGDANLTAPGFALNWPPARRKPSFIRTLVDRMEKWLMPTLSLPCACFRSCWRRVAPLQATNL